MSEVCPLCFSDKNIQRHHMVFQSQVKELAHCKLNFIYVCRACHVKIHKKDSELDEEVKLKFRNKIELKFLKRYLTYEEVKSVLEISNTATKKLLKGLVVYKEGYKREDIINRCMGIKGGSLNEIYGK